MRSFLATACAVLLASTAHAQGTTSNSLAVAAQGAPPQHGAYVNMLSFSSDGQLLASGSGRESTVKVWRVSSGKLARTLDVAPLALQTFIFGSDPGRIAIGARDRNNEKFQLWDARAGTKITENEIGTMFDYLSYSADGFHAWGQPDYANGGSQYQVLTISANDASVITRREVDSSSATVGGVQFTADGKFVASSFFHGESSYTLNVWDAASGQLALQTRPASARGIALSRDSTKIALATNRGIDLLAFDGQVLHSINLGLMDVTAVSPNGVFFVAGGREGRVALLAVASGAEIMTEAASRSNVNAVAFSPDSKLLAAGFGDGTIHLWNTADGKSAKFKVPAK